LRSTDLALGFLWIGPPDQVRISWPTLLGYTPLVLLALGFRGVRRQPIWLLLAAAALLLSLGPSLYLGGRDTGVPLPSAWLADVPILFMLRKPDRFVIVMQLALAILSAFAWRDLSGRTSDARIQWGLWILILALAGAELRGSPLPMSQRPAAEFATAVARLVDTAEGQDLRTIAELPMFAGSDQGARANLHQTLHGLAMPQGYVTLDLAMTPALVKQDARWRHAYSLLQRGDAGPLADRVREQEIDLVVLHKTAPRFRKPGALDATTVWAPFSFAAPDLLGIRQRGAYAEVPLLPRQLRVLRAAAVEAFGPPLHEDARALVFRGHE